MRVALLSAQDEIEVAPDGARVLRADQSFVGRSLLRHQLECALSLGCERIVVFGVDAQSTAAKTLVSDAEPFDAQVDLLTNPRRFAGAITATDTVLVFADGALVDGDLVEDTIGNRFGIVTVPVDAGMAAGFERIDGEQAWGGVMQVPGSLIERLSNLPEDVAVPSALLRLALQAGVPRLAVNPEALQNWALAMPVAGPQTDARAADWARMRAAPGDLWAPFTGATERLLIPLLPAFFSNPLYARVLTGLTTGLLLLTAVAAIANWLVIGFAAILGASVGVVLSNTVARAMRFAAFRLHTRSVAHRYLELALEVLLAVLVFRALLELADPVYAIFATAMLIGLRVLATLSPDFRLRRMASDTILLAFLLFVALCLSFFVVTVQVLAIVLLLAMLWISRGRLTTN